VPEGTGGRGRPRTGHLCAVFFAYNATKTDILAALTAAQQWAGARCQESLGIGVQYTEGRGPFVTRHPL
jgi:hypothetical protein